MDLFKSGLWIPFLILLIAAIYSLVLILRHLARFQQGRSSKGAEFNQSFLGNLVEIELMKEGEALLENGCPDEAVEVLERSKKLNSDFPLTHYLLGKAYLALGDKGQSFDSFKRFIQMASGYDERQQNRISEAKRCISELEGDIKLSRPWGTTMIP